MGCNHRRSSDPGLSDHPFAVEGPFLATPLDGDVIEVPDHPLVRAIFGALMSAGVGARTAGWHADAQGATTIQRIGLYPIRVTLEANHAADAWRAVEEISPLILDVLVLLLACDRPTASARLLRSADVLKLKGCRRFGDERRILEEQVSAQIHLLRRLSIAGELLFKLTEVSPGAHVFVHEPQVWLQELYLKAGRRPIDVRLLQLDHRANRGPDLLAKKIGLQLSLSVAGSVSVRSVWSLLRSVGAIESAGCSRSSRSGRLAERFEEARLRLHERGLFHIRYRKRQGLDDADRVKGWVKRWLRSELVIATGAELLGSAAREAAPELNFRTGRAGGELEASLAN